MSFKYPRIFWLEDNPDFLPFICTDDSSSPTGIPSLLSRVTFAFDFEMGQEILSKNTFDLHILDGDFPNRSSDARRDYLKKYLQEQCIEQFRLGIKGEIVSSNFIRFHREHLISRQPAILHSYSERAAVGAYTLRIPFYHKTSDRDGARKIKEYVEACRDEFTDWPPHSLEAWEVGIDVDLAQRYLFSQAS